ncbi:MAG TPA: hypothetical protein VNO83_11835 [Pseudonocardia sp.]|nr:hypothetical protein [Pseudonocardia sp.]
MSRMRAVLAAVAVVTVAAGCGEPAETTVEKAFRGYHSALVARDFRTACAYNSPEATDKLLASVRTQGIDAADCEDAFTAIYSEEGAAAAADGVHNSVQIQKVAVDGDTATIDWSAQLDGEQRPARTTMHRADGRWLLVVN